MGDMASYYGGDDFDPDDADPGLAVGYRRYDIDEIRRNNQAARRQTPMQPSRNELLKAKATAEALLGQLEEELEQIEEKLAVAYPAEPGPGHDRFRVLVQFGGPRSKKYEFLLLRSMGKWFTTGTADENKVFPSWASLLDWLDGSDVRWHSDLQRLRLDTVAWHLRTGELIANDEGESPF